jgi:transposase
MLTEFSASELQAVLEERLRNAPPRESRRTLCLWLCNRGGFSNPEIAGLLGLEVRAVQRLRERFEREGGRALYQTPGGNRKILSREQELSLLLGFFVDQKQNPSLSLRYLYERTLGRPISQLSFTRFLARFGLPTTVK